MPARAAILAFVATALLLGGGPRALAADDAGDAAGASAASARASSPDASTAGAAADPASAQASSPATDAPAGSPARVAVSWIPPEDVVERAELVLRNLEARRSEAAVDDVIATITEAASVVDADLRESVVDSRAVVNGSSSWLALQVARRQLRDASVRLDAMNETLAGELKRLGGILDGFRATSELWKRTLSRNETAEAGPAVVRRVESTLADLREAEEDVGESRARLLALSDRLLERSTYVAGTLAKLDATGEALFAHILQPDRPPLWRRDVPAGLAREWPMAPERLHRFRQATNDYIEHDARPFLVQLAVALVLMAAFRHLPRNAATRLADAPVPESTRRLLNVPYALALLLALAMSSMLHPTAPQRAMQVLALLGALPVLRVVMVAGRRATPTLAAGLVAVLMLDRAAVAFVTLPALSLVLFLAQVSVSFLWALAFRQRLRATGGSEAAQRRMTILAGVLVVAFAAEVGGWSTLGMLLGRIVMTAGVTAFYTWAVVLAASALLSYALVTPALRHSRFVDRNQHLVHRWGTNVLRLAGLWIWLSLVVTSLGLRREAGDFVDRLLAAGVSVGEMSVSVGGLLAFAVTILVSLALSRLVNEVLEDEVFPRTNLPRGIPTVLAALSRYSIWSLGFLLALSAAGVEVGQLSILLGGLGVGIGLGLQDVVKNFAAGLTLLLERRVHVGDAVEIPDKNVDGRVVSIGMRASVVRNYNGAEVVLPNDDLVSGTITNWTLHDSLYRIEIPVGVAYGTDPKLVIQLLLAAAAADPELRRQPPPSAFFVAFGESSLDFVLRAWADDYDSRRSRTSTLALAVHDALRDAGIEIPFPQREVNLVNVTPDAAATLRDAVSGGDATAPR